MKQGYQVESDVVETLAEVAELLGVSKVTGKDVAEGGKYADLVQMVQITDDSADDQHDDTNSGNLEDGEENDSSNEQGYSALGDEKVEATPEDILEAMPEFKDVEELKGLIKDLDMPTLEYMARGLKLTWKPTDHRNIHRMRVAEAIKKHFFPELYVTKESSNKKAKYGDLTTEELFAMVTERELRVNKSGNEPIDRMRAIMALKTVGALDA